MSTVPVIQMLQRTSTIPLTRGIVLWKISPWIIWSGRVLQAPCSAWIIIIVLCVCTLFSLSVQRNSNLPQIVCTTCTLCGLYRSLAACYILYSMHLSLYSPQIATQSEWYLLQIVLCVWSYPLLSAVLIFPSGGASLSYPSGTPHLQSRWTLSTEENN